MRVLFHLLDAGVGGGQIVAERVARRLTARGDTVTVVFPSSGPTAARFEAIGARVELLDVATLRRPDSAQGLARLLREHDLLYSHTSIPGVVLGGIAARIARRRHVVHQHTFPYFSTTRATRVLQRTLLPRTAGRAQYIAVAEHVRAGLMAAGVRSERIAVVPNGVPPITVEPMRADSEVIAGMLARLDPGKNAHVFLDAVEVTRPRTALRAVVGGASSPFAEYERELRARATQMGVEIVRVDDAEPFLRSLDIVTIPSAYEGSPLVLLEAMALGRAVVASDIPGMREVVDTNGGVLVPPGDSEALARALEELADDPTRRAELGERAAQIVATRYRLETMLDRTLAILDAV